ncbi:O-methyltransferase [Longispora fulva]|uniref:Ubiquinone/menaquinone biosynthesis C-methylase UbiE n=1 Tax=Longispora fulva TaxID=619741 RepID=A0A8J7GS42_9ACTN|nr:acetylserotonin O-methyltransferase [Longispora fulva]MBG6137218.1 ubiquinone/menaquinone biosynthesis C-methylase UbiE [Longispora fulva]GIG61428.1 O-methyltransferase [Longispora fulva]
MTLRLENANPLTPDDLTLLLFGAAAFQQLRAGCELGLFELLHAEPGRTRDEIARRLGLADRAVDTLLLGTTSLRLTTLAAGSYSNCAVVDALFASGDWGRFADVVGFEQYVVYAGQADYTESLRDNTNIGLRRVPGEGPDLYHRLAEDPFLGGVFYRYMRSWSELANRSLTERVDFDSVSRVLDMGGGDGVNALALAEAHPHLFVTVVDLPENLHVARGRIAAAGLADRVSVYAADMFTDPLPGGHDCVLFSHQLVIWTPEENVALLRRAHEALEPGGRVVIFSSMSRDDGTGPVMAALDSVYFTAIPAEGGMIYPAGRYLEWTKEAGFDNAAFTDCSAWTPHGIVQATRA